MKTQSRNDLINLNEQLTKLSTRDMKQISGGKSLWSYISYGIGLYAGAVAYGIDIIKKGY